MMKALVPVRFVALSAIALLAGCGDGFSAAGGAGTSGSAGSDGSTGGRAASSGGSSSTNPASTGGSSSGTGGHAAGSSGDGGVVAGGGSGAEGGQVGLGGEGGVGATGGSEAGGTQSGGQGGETQSGGSEAGGTQSGGQGGASGSGGGGIVAPRALGAACNSASQCASDECVDGVCCESACSGVCAQCDAPGSEGSCVAAVSDTACGELSCPPDSPCREYVAGNLQENCEQLGVCLATAPCEIVNLDEGTACETAAGSGTCDGGGACDIAGLASLGDPCNADDECSSNACAPSNICCDAACDGACEECGSDGHCDQMPATDPLCIIDCPSSTECADYAESTTAGECTAFSRCITEAAHCGPSLHAAGESCGESMICDDGGVCVDCPAGTGSSHSCSVECPCAAGEGVCTSSEQCTAGQVCTAAAVAKLGFPSGTMSCMPAHCDNNTLDGTETSQDCGGDCGCRATYEEITATGYPVGTNVVGLGDMSGDGSAFAAGVTNYGSNPPGTRPAMVTASGVTTALESYGMPGATFVISVDGSRIYGQISCADPPDCTDNTSVPVSWTNGGPPVPFTFGGSIFGVSATESMLGYTTADYPSSVYRRVVATGLNTEATGLKWGEGMSGNGAVIWGEASDDPNITTHGLWSTATGPFVPDYPPTFEDSRIEAISQDGSIAIGYGVPLNATSGEYVPFKIQNGTYSKLPLISASATGLWPLDISADGTRFVACSYTSVAQAALWDEQGGLRTVIDELAARGLEFPIDFPELAAQSCWISDDGRTIVCRSSAGMGAFWRVKLLD